MAPEDAVRWADGAGERRSPGGEEGGVATTLGIHSPRLAAVRALRTKAGRREHGRFAVAGRTMLDEALACGCLPEAVYATEAGIAGLGPLAERLTDRLYLVAPRALERLSDLESPPALLAVHPTGASDLGRVLAGGRPVLVLAGVSDPGNAGSLLRSAEAFGLGGAIFAGEAVEPYNPKVVRATMGAIFRLPIAVAPDPRAVREAATRLGYAVVVADRAGALLPTFRFPSRSLLVVGAERHGPGDWLAVADGVVAIPQPGRGESLNAAVAGGILLYAFSQQIDALEPLV